MVNPLSYFLGKLYLKKLAQNLYKLYGNDDNIGRS